MLTVGEYIYVGVNFKILLIFKDGVLANTIMLDLYADYLESAKLLRGGEILILLCPNSTKLFNIKDSPTEPQRLYGLMFA